MGRQVVAAACMRARSLPRPRGSEGHCVSGHRPDPYRLAWTLCLHREEEREREGEIGLGVGVYALSEGKQRCRGSQSGWPGGPGWPGCMLRPPRPGLCSPPLLALPHGWMLNEGKWAGVCPPEYPPVGAGRL